MDRIERRSWVASLLVHLVLVLVSLFGFGIPVIALRSAAAPEPAPPPNPSAAGEVVLAEDTLAERSPPLPPLRALRASGTPVIVPQPTSHAGDARSRGDQRERIAPVALPLASTPPTPNLDALRGQRSNPALSAEAANRATAADHLDFLVYTAFPRLWRGYATQITNRQLVIEVVADDRGIIREARLFHCTTGVAELDRAIPAWLVEQGTSLPRIPPGQPLRFAVALP